MAFDKWWRCGCGKHPTRVKQKRKDDPLASKVKDHVIARVDARGTTSGVRETTRRKASQVEMKELPVPKAPDLPLSPTGRIPQNDSWQAQLSRPCVPTPHVTIEPVPWGRAG